VAERLLADLKLLEHQDALAYFKHCCSGLARGRKVLFISSTGCLCSGSKGIVVGDSIALVAGVPLPLILRTAEGESQAASAVVGPAFVLGIMDGEAWRPEASAEIVADMRTKKPPNHRGTSFTASSQLRKQDSQTPEPPSFLTIVLWTTTLTSD